MDCRVIKSNDADKKLEKTLRRYQRFMNSVENFFLNANDGMYTGEQIFEMMCEYVSDIEEFKKEWHGLQGIEP